MFEKKVIPNTNYSLFLSLMFNSTLEKKVFLRDARTPLLITQCKTGLQIKNMCYNNFKTLAPNILKPLHSSRQLFVFDKFDNFSNFNFRLWPSCFHKCCHYLYCLASYHNIFINDRLKNSIVLDRINTAKTL